MTNITRLFAERLASLRLAELAAAELGRRDPSSDAIRRAVEFRQDCDLLRLTLARRADGPEALAWAQIQVDARLPEVLDQIGSVAA